MVSLRKITVAILRLRVLLRRIGSSQGACSSARRVAQGIAWQDDCV